MPSFKFSQATFTQILLCTYWTTYLQTYNQKLRDICIRGHKKPCIQAKKHVHKKNTKKHVQTFFTATVKMGQKIMNATCFEALHGQVPQQKKMGVKVSPELTITEITVPDELVGHNKMHFEFHICKYAKKNDASSRI